MLWFNLGHLAQTNFGRLMILPNFTLGAGESFFIVVPPTSNPGLNETKDISTCNKYTVEI